jgi:hypothetical protein
MRMRSIIMLAAVTMVLAAAGIGNAFANTWSGTDQSNNNNGAYTWYSYVGGTPSVGFYTTLSWEDGFYNVGDKSYYAAYDYQQDTYNNLHFYSSALLGQYGYWWPDTANEPCENLVGSHYLIVNHKWGVSNGQYGNAITYNQPYTVHS